MKIFLSWSGDLSYAVASLFKEWLPNVIQSIEPPYLSAKDIEKGSAWFPDIANQLKESAFGLICLTSENLDSPWIHFEAGAIANKFEMKHIPAFLVDIDAKDVKSPLSQFQLTSPNEEDVFGLLSTINNVQGDKQLTTEQLKSAFKMWWTEFDAQFKSAIALGATKHAPATKRSQEDILEEILLISRSTSQVVSGLAEQTRSPGITFFPQTTGSQFQSQPGDLLGGGYLSYPIAQIPYHFWDKIRILREPSAKISREALIAVLAEFQEQNRKVTIADLTVGPTSTPNEIIGILQQLMREGKIEWDGGPDSYTPAATIKFISGAKLS